MANQSTFRQYVDRAFASALLLVASPFLLGVGALVRVRLGSPVLFRQIRSGLAGSDFELLKFRSMTDERGADGALLADEERLTPFGRFLRSTSIDELPTLINVVRGDMAIVGPRPLLPEYLPLYSDEQRRRCDVLPGVTGWAQVNGRNALSWEEKFEYDIWYVDNQHPLLDLRILFRTIKRVALRSDISSEGVATAPRFTGSG